MLKSYRRIKIKRTVLVKGFKEERYMREISEQLYRGEINGAEQYFNADQPRALRDSKRALELQETCLGKLQKDLSSSSQRLLQEYLQAEAGAELFKKEENFIRAFRLGARMMPDVLSANDTAFTNLPE